jgi:uncharacterized OB-fold protein
MSGEAIKLAIPLPVPNPDNQGFWEACRRHELRLQRCTSCGTLRHPPRPMCPSCNGPEHDWALASGRGRVYSYTVVHGPTLPAFETRAPYNVIVVQLDEGPFLVSNLVAPVSSIIRIGMAVEVTFEDISDTVTLPKFRASS